MSLPLVQVFAFVLFSCGTFVAALWFRRRGRTVPVYFFTGAGMAGIAGLLHAFAVQIEADPVQQQDVLSSGYPQLAEIASITVLIPALIAFSLIYYGFRLLWHHTSNRTPRR